MKEMHNFLYRIDELDGKYKWMVKTFYFQMIYHFVFYLIFIQRYRTIIEWNISINIRTQKIIKLLDVFLRVTKLCMLCLKSLFEMSIRFSFRVLFVRI